MFSKDSSGLSGENILERDMGAGWWRKSKKEDTVAMEEKKNKPLTTGFIVEAAYIKINWDFLF